jgi:hypothetical protein
MKFTFNAVHAAVGTVVVALVSFAMPGGAQAAGITASIRLAGDTGLAGAQWNFSTPAPTGVTLSPTTIPVAAIVSGSSPGQYADPGAGDPGAGDFSYLTVGGNIPAAPTASLTFTTALKNFGLFWGTPDSRFAQNRERLENYPVRAR